MNYFICFILQLPACYVLVNGLAALTGLAIWWCIPITVVIVEGTYEEIKQKIETLESSFPKNGRMSPKLTNYYMEGTTEEMEEYGFGKEVVYL